MPDRRTQSIYEEAAQWHEILYRALTLDWENKRAVRKFLEMDPKKEAEKTLKKGLAKYGFH